MWKALRDGLVGRPRLAYAEMDDGLLHTMDFREWRGDSGAPWPYVDELETGCTVEHAGYALTWLTAFFGPAERVVAYSALTVPDKDIPEVSREAMAIILAIHCAAAGAADVQIRTSFDPMSPMPWAQ
jgi:predicted dehydrogenase